MATPPKKRASVPKNIQPKSGGQNPGKRKTAQGPEVNAAITRETAGKKRTLFQPRSCLVQVVSHLSVHLRRVEEKKEEEGTESSKETKVSPK